MEKTVIYANNSPKIVNPRDIAGNAEEEEEEEYVGPGLKFRPSHATGWKKKLALKIAIIIRIAITINLI